ncbi:Antitoxin component YwqK of the YwqJK toxin-antitoxin module [Zobellia uliginosa]|uniref:Antitoxin component YwqK of the YwqJK toxin-antitoxin module n=1 Tax=Zobellia uliginosa TaxID=143224 RepID=A0ABY1KR71_9FLAO|nr:toxin-antitoxin system YwqK family antitoxin [Zobellia uliginosa]SIS47388.1 Antitoxin component YwqK of the YwqJK toxin-antitoxin module [Zobellia uliginosa]
MEIFFLYKLYPLSILISLTLFSCQEKQTSSISLNKADGIYKLKEQPFTGKVLDTTRSGRVLLTFNCVKGKIDGKYLEYYAENGNLKQKSTYIKGNKTGPYLQLKLNGDTITYGTFLNYKKNGIWKEFYGNGKLKSVGKYENNLQNGLWKYYYYNTGKIKAEGHYLNGDETKLGRTSVPISGRHGEWQFYFENTGKLKQKSEFENGIRSGKFTVYQSNGLVEFTANFKNDKYHGVVEVFDKTGKLELKKYYENGEQISDK